jgi:hypothetical protein
MRAFDLHVQACVACSRCLRGPSQAVLDAQAKLQAELKAATMRALQCGATTVTAQHGLKTPVTQPLVQLPPGVTILYLNPTEPLALPNSYTLQQRAGVCVARPAASQLHGVPVLDLAGPCCRSTS